jgi:hypothetical protein
MTPRRDQARLAAYQCRYQDLAQQLADVGLVHGGSLLRRYTRCANPRCRCQADPPSLHGPYWQWTAKVAGKTVTRRLTDTEAALYADWIANDRQLRRLVAEMRQVAAGAIQLILGDEAAPSPPGEQPAANPAGETRPATT